MTTPSRSAYETDVFRWGSNNPWPGNLNHRDRFTPAEVETDGSGNVLNMPRLLGKPCFGRPETFFRHGRRNLPVVTPYGVKEKPSRCGRCPIREACKGLSLERVRSAPAALAALAEWGRQTHRAHGEQRYTGNVGRYWSKFLKAVATHGPFTSSNDAAIADAAAVKLERQRRKAREIKARQRAARRSAGLPPLPEFVRAVLDERNARLAALEAARTMPGVSRKISKLDRRGCEITASAWAAKVLLAESGKKVTGKTVADWIIAHALPLSGSYDAFRVRVVSADLPRIAELEAGGLRAIWKPFDPYAHMVAREFEAA